MRTSFFIFTLILLACGSNSKMKSANWFEGVWQYEGMDKIEKWNKINDYAFQGLVLSGSGEDLRVLEYLRLYRLDNSWHLAAIVPDQNDGREITFNETKSAVNQIQFENLEHNYPKKIDYLLQNDSTIIATLNKGMDKELSLKLTRIKNY